MRSEDSPKYYPAFVFSVGKPRKAQPVYKCELKTNVYRPKCEPKTNDALIFTFSLQVYNNNYCDVQIGNISFWNAMEFLLNWAYWTDFDYRFLDSRLDDKSFSTE
ncbi:hypothetical protein ANN_02100 [Periplaneta americana]|uniref:Uncharacterized protein n=1 Tax=Periplaneta americana TaxID=6978 RepID=A0ABQ8TVB9_PERAM|nr:hypothetical protein ANN_02100 [Periplaneta americana]